MAWVRIDDKFTEHPKLVQAGPLGVAMQIAALCYANRHLTDGELPANIVARFMPTVCYDPETGEEITWRDVADRLVEIGIWHKTDGGYLIHDYLEYQPSKADVEAERAAARERMARIRSKRKANTSRSSDDVRANTERSSPSPNPNPNIDDDDNNARAREEEQWSEFRQVFVEAYGGLPNSAHYEEIDGFLAEGMSLDAVIEAVRRAALNKAKGWSYVRRILQNWLKDGLLTVEQIREHEEKRQSRTRASPPSPPQDGVPSWIDQELEKYRRIVEEQRRAKEAETA